MVLLYGYQPEKLQAGQYLLLYTVLASLPLFITLVTQPPFLSWLVRGSAAYLGVTLTLGFIVKRPLYLVHIWLPKAHVEAPVATSIALAGVLLKLGSFGLLLFLPVPYAPCITPLPLSQTDRERGLQDRLHTAVGHQKAYCVLLGGAYRRSYGWGGGREGAGVPLRGHNSARPRRMFATSICLGLSLLPG